MIRRLVVTLFTIISVLAFGIPISPVSAATTTNTVTLAAPSNLVAVALSSTSIKLTWKDNCTNEDSFHIYMNDVNDGTAYDTFKVGTNTSSYQVIGLTSGKTYYFFVKAWKGTDYSNPSNFANATTPNRLPSLSDLIANVSSSGTINFMVTYTDLDGDEVTVHNVFSNGKTYLMTRYLGTNSVTE